MAQRIRDLMQKILLIDDKRDNLVTLAALLKNLMPELTISSAQSGAEGIEKAQTGQPDVILLDIMMPDMDGYETCRRLTTGEATRHIPVILLTAIKTNTASRVKGLEMGANSFLTKPVDEGELVSQVRVALRIKRAEDALHKERRELEKLVQKRTIALQESERKWRNILVNTPQIGVSLDTQARITFANKQFLNLTGWSRKEVIGQDWFKMFIPADICDEVREVFHASMKSEEALGHSTHENDIVTRDGSRLTVSWSNVVTRTLNGKITDVTCLGVDITERQRAENVLRETKTLLETAGRVAHFGGWSVNLADNRSKWSDEVSAIHGMPPGYSPDVSEGMAFYAPEWQARISKVFNDCVSKGVPYDEEMEIITSQGRRVWVRTTGQAVYDESGKIIRVEGAFQDISAHKQSETELKTSKEQIRFQEELLRNSPMLTVFHDTDFNVIWHNKAFSDATGLAAHEIAGKKCYAAWGMQEPCRDCPGLSTLKSGEPRQAELILGDQSDLSKSHRSWDVRSIPARNAEKKLIGAIEIALDISERVKLNNQFIHAQKIESVGRLAGGVAHDFNNMLGVILGYSEMAMEILSPSEPVYAFLKEIFGAAGRSREITRQLLAFARKQTISPQVLDLNETVESMLKMLRRLIGENIELIWKPANRRCTVNMDPSQIDQILANLCVNAGDAIADVGEISIGTELVVIGQDSCTANPGFIPGEFVKLTVRDSGCGMDEQTMNQLFEPFFTTKDVGKGSGLGLATVYGIVNQNNGFIDVSSAPEKGSTFNIYLPCCLSDAGRPKQNSALSAPSGQGETILIVEDELALLKISKIMLEKLNYKILTASTPKEGIRLAKEFNRQISLLITDVIMPEMSGRQLADYLLQLNPDLKVLFMSGYTSDVIAHQGILDEGIQFLQKPFLITDLALKIHLVLHNS